MRLERSEERYSTRERKEERDDAPEADARTEVLLYGRSKRVSEVCVWCERSKSGRSKLSVNMVVVMRPMKWRAGTT